MIPIALRRSFLTALLLLLAACTQPAAAPVATTDGESGRESGTESAADPQPTMQSNVLTAVKVDGLTDIADADYWAEAPMLAIDTKGSREGDPDGPQVRMQAAYDGDTLAIRAEWSDDTESVLKNAWTWDGSEFTKSGNEDRLMFVWPIENNPEFATKGCAGACHNMADDEKEWWMGTEDEGMRLDAWHWKSARTNPVGQSDDKWWGTLTDPADPESSRHGDAKDGGGYSDNRTEDKSGPLFVHGSDPSSPFILTDDAVEIDSSQLAENSVIPGYLLAPFAGSRGDLAANGVWADGKWTVVLTRSLDTSHDDDVSFTPPKRYSFGIAIIDDGSGLDHTVAPEVLVLEWQ